MVNGDEYNSTRTEMEDSREIGKEGEVLERRNLEM